MERQRLQKFMAHAGVASRRKCEELIAAGKVKVNGKVVTEMGYTVDPSVDRVEVAGLGIIVHEKKEYILLYKPAGVLSSASDDRGRKTVVDLIKNAQTRLYPVGRLDYDTEGLILLTNDGRLTNLLIHPRYKVDKTYRAVVQGIPGEDKLAALRNGIMLEDGPTYPARVKMLKQINGNGLVEITIHEGRNRQVRRMFDAIGHPVLKLKRTRFGFLELGNLQPGQYRALSSAEVAKLYDLVTVPGV
ncbi:pseudouridine synthase [Thermincola ferriacetica]|uniref:Pseudouridine synthase n=1 Tax=Thermincola ferriacetica TaxID=281456 RepID=A0A0L6W5Q8_9FIRM|nr:pseudouridine synthase [Thermincola ferriacetica]KNZ70811.1 pseudouridine synthase [Thermincola ferriacetica]